MVQLEVPVSESESSSEIYSSLSSDIFVESESSLESQESIRQEVRFDPPVWEQRRLFVLNLLRENWEYVDWILDLGCGSGALESLLVNSCLISRISMLELLEDELTIAVQTLKPSQTDYFSPNERPVTIDVLQGCLTYFEPSFKNVDAVILLEVIEHLDPEILNQVPKLFEYNPSLVVISTPNADYNRYFPNFQPGQFRHDDHRFEWTQVEFQAWCMQFLQNYTVSFHGVGKFQETHDCFSTQIAVFRNKQMRAVSKWPLQPTQMNLQNWKLFHKIEYPWFQDIKDPKELLDLIPPEGISMNELWMQYSVRLTFRTLTRLYEYIQSNDLLELEGNVGLLHFVEYGQEKGGIVKIK